MAGDVIDVPVSGTLNGGAVTVITDDDDALSFDDTTGTTQVQLPDGQVEITFGIPPTADPKDAKFDDNLAEFLDDGQLSQISEKLLLGIETDLQSRDGWIQNMRDGISLLGLEVKNARGTAASGTTSNEGVSNVDHPLLLEAVLRFQANAYGELLPADGPVKVRNDGPDNALAARLAPVLEKDLNYYLTKVAKEYYPDTDRMLLMLGFSGIGFKKGYHDPIKRRPTIISINAEDLIVSNAATDLDGAGRVTHRVYMRPSTLRRMQLLKEYRDIELPSPGMPLQKDAVKDKIDQVQGISPPSYVDPADQDRELYESYCEIDVPGFEHKIDGKLTGLPLPYRVTIDKESRRILEIRRNWDPEDEFCLPVNRIIAYVFIPGLGFYGIGLLNILGNATKAVSAAWRLMLDAGMFANFPGFLFLKSLAKQLTNQFRIPPGGGMPIDSNADDIRQVVMPLPYKDVSPVFIQLIENIATTAQRVGGTAEMQIGEGRQDAPVGTTLALIEQATKLMSAVHKRLHKAQDQELEMLKDLLAEDPAALWRHNKKSKVLALLMEEKGDQAISDAQEETEERRKRLFVAALADCQLTPRADPNTSSQMERYLKAVAMRQMAMSNPGLDINKVDERALHVMGVDDTESLFKPAPPAADGGPPPEALMAVATMLAAQARMKDSETKALDAQTRAQTTMRKIESSENVASLNLARDIIIHQDDAKAEAENRQREDQHRSSDRIQRLALAAIAGRQKSQQGVANMVGGMISEHLGRQHESRERELERQHQGVEAQRGREFEAATRPRPAAPNGKAKK